MAFRSIMTLWVRNGAVLKKFQSMAIERIFKINNSWPELFDFQNSFMIHDTYTSGILSNQITRIFFEV